jgi:isochorismate pyruvate lyase
VSGPARDCASLAEVRAEIDRLDRLIVPLLAERAGYVLQAARFKSRAEEVPAPARVEEVVAKVRALAAEAGADPALIEAIYRPMIAAFIASEMPEFERLHRGDAG